MKFKNICIVVMLFISILALPTASARADGIWDFFFPTVRTEPNPAETLKAPFANDDMVIEEIDASGHASNMTPLHLRHRTNDIIDRWVQTIIPDMLSYNANDYEQQIGVNILSFSKAGSDEYKDFLRKQSFITTLKTGRYNIVGFISGYPVILNEGAVDGSYSWVFKSDVMITYQDKNIDYKSNKREKSISKEFILTFQISRNRKSTNEHGVLIESWSVKPKKK